MIATPTTTTAMMTGPRPRLLRAILLWGGAAIFCGGAIFFDDTRPFFPLWLCVVLVLNWLLLYCLWFFDFDCFVRSCLFQWFPSPVCPHPPLPERGPSHPSH